MSTGLTVRGLHRRFGDHDVIEGLDLCIEPGGRVALLGPNGSGKSTVLRCVAGTLEPTTGSVLIGGHEAGSLHACRLTGVSLSQERSFYLRLSGLDNLMFFARMRGFSRRRAGQVVAGLVQELSLGAFVADRTDTYSTGMILQLAFARALLGEPPLLVLDEPTRSLDTAAVDRLWAALNRRRESAVLIATHREDDVERCNSSIDLDL